MKYLNGYGFYIGSHALIMESGHDQINELSMLHSNNYESVFTDSPQDILRD